MRIALTILTLFSIIACNNKQTPINTRYNVLANNLAGLVIAKPDSMAIHEEGCIRISNRNKQYKIESAYIDCYKDSITAIDTHTKTIEGCNKKLYLENDTIIICFKPQVAKKEYSHNLVLLLSNNNQFYVYDTSFAVMSK